MLPLRDLPAEIRESIFWHSDLQLQNNNQAPALLLALAADPVLYAQLRPIYKAKNAVVTLCNQQAFKKIKMRELLKYRYLKLQFPEHEDIPEPVPDPEFELELRANKCLLKNNFETLTFDFTNNADSPAWAWCEFMIPISRASSWGIRRLVVEFQRPIFKARYPGQDGFCDLEYARGRIDEISGTKSTETTLMRGTKKIYIWTWESRDGKKFTLNP